MNIQVIGMIAVAVIGVVAMILLVVARLRKDDKQVKDFDPKPIESMIKPEIRKLGNMWANTLNVKLRYNYNTIGTVYKSIDFTSNINATESRYRDEDPEDHVEKDNLETAKANGDISEKTYQQIKDFREEDVHIMFVRSSGLVDKYIFKLYKLLGWETKISKIVVVPDRLIEYSSKYIRISKTAEMTRFVGMEVAKEPSTYRFIENIVYRQLYEDSLENQKNYHDKVNFYDSNFTQSIQELKAEARAEREKWSNKGSGMVNEED